MIDVTNLKYKIIIITADAKEFDITDATTDVGWEEGDGELAMRIGITTHNTPYGAKRLSSIARPNCVVVILADWGNGYIEVARGTIVDWQTGRSGSNNTKFEAVAYDELFNLQQSQDNRYYAAGTGTKIAISTIFQDWGIPLETYNGPNVKHAKTIFKNEYLSDILIQLLNDATKKGGVKCIIRASKGRASIIPLGGNATIYQFDADINVTSTQAKISTAHLTTRVKIVGKEDSEGRQPVESTVDGQIQYGIRQRIYNRKEDDSLATAKSAAQEILKEYGKPTRYQTIESPDVPMIRKGDKVHIRAGTMNGYFIVKAIRHNAIQRSMTMEVEAER